MKTLEERISFLLEEVGNSPTRMAEIAGVKPPSVSDWVNGKTKSLRSAPAIRLAKHFNVNMLWLTEGRGPMRDVLHSSDTAPAINLSYSSIERSHHENESDNKNIVIRQFDTGGSMGAGVLLRDQPGVIQSWRVSPEWLDKNVRSHTGAKNLCIVTGFGDSMRGMFEPGDPLIVDTGVRSVEFDAIYFFRVENEGFIKRLQRIPGEGIRAISENKAYESWTIKPDMDFEVFGRVLKAWKSEDY